MFDTVTGQIVQAIPQPAAAESERDLLQTAVPAESLADHTAAGAMPWEQMDSPPETIPAAGAPIPPTEGSIHGIAADVPFSIGESSTGIVEQEIATDKRPSGPKNHLGRRSLDNPLSRYPPQCLERQNRLKSPRRTKFRCSIQRAVQRRPLRIRRQELKRNPVVIPLRLENNRRDSTPMPWDQVEEAAPEYSLTADSQASTVAEVLPALSGCPDPPPVARISEPVIEMPGEGSAPVAQRSRNCRRYDHAPG